MIRVPTEPPVVLDQLANWSVQVDEAQDELALGLAADDLGLAFAAARRIQSLGFLMGDAVRKHEKATRR